MEKIPKTSCFRPFFSEFSRFRIKSYVMKLIKYHLPTIVKHIFLSPKNDFGIPKITWLICKSLGIEKTPPPFGKNSQKSRFFVGSVPYAVHFLIYCFWGFLTNTSTGLPFHFLTFAFTFFLFYFQTSRLRISDNHINGLALSPSSQGSEHLYYRWMFRYLQMPLQHLIELRIHNNNGGWIWSYLQSLDGAQTVECGDEGAE